MRNSLGHTALVLALLGGVSLAGAQEKASDVGQKPAAQAPSGAIPANNSGSLTNPATQATNAAPFEAPGSSASGGPAASNEGASLEPGGPPGATGQTMPSTRSSRNAAEDKRPIVAHTLDLSGEQKQKLTQLMAPQMSAGTSGSGSAGNDGLTVGNPLPAAVTIYEFPRSVTEQMPEMQKYKYVQMPDKILIVEPDNRIVVGSIGR